jgi:ribonuclease HIII
MKENYFVCSIDLSELNRFREDLIQQGFLLSDQKDAIFSAKKTGINLVLYKSGKLVVQGKEIHPFIEFYLEPEILKRLDFTNPHANLDTTPRIGVDEAGKGDFFGPLSIGAVFVEQNLFESLIKIGVKDSKSLDDKTILILAEKIKALCPTESIVIYPEKYNQLYSQFQNLNKLLAWGHAKAIENLHQKTGCKTVICDQFAASKSVIENALKFKGLNLDLNQKHKAESDLAVAAASIIARAGFLNGMERLSKQYGMELPKGASSIVQKKAHEFIKTHGTDLLSKVVKTHFKTYLEVLKALDASS